MRYPYGMIRATSVNDVRVLFSPGKRFKQVLGTAQFQKVNGS
jgi:hypothetical protein